MTNSSSNNDKHHDDNDVVEFNLIKLMFDFIDFFVELYLKFVIKPFLKFHEIFYKELNNALRSFLDYNRSKIPTWFTANFITYLRTVFVVPCLLLLSKHHTVLPCVIILLVDFGDFLDGVVARYWVDEKKNEKKKNNIDVDADEDDFVVVSSTTTNNNNNKKEETTVSILSWGVLHRQRTYGGFVDAVCDKAFVVPCWISLLHIVPNTSYLQVVQMIALIGLILAETSSACIRFRAYFTASGVPSPKVQEGYESLFSTSAVKADHVGKAKQTFEMVGTALYVIPIMRYIGLILLVLALPLAYESVRRKIKKRIIYVHYNTLTTTNFNHKIIKFWMQAKSMGSKLIIGIPKSSSSSSDENDDAGKNHIHNKNFILNACSISCVDEIIVDVPNEIDSTFLEKQNIDFVLSYAGQEQFVTDDVCGANCCLIIGEDNIARLPKVTKTVTAAQPPPALVDDDVDDKNNVVEKSKDV